MVQKVIALTAALILQSFSYAGTGMRIRLESLSVPTAYLAETSEDCMRSHSSIITVNSTQYFESNDSSIAWDHCFPTKKNSKISFNLFGANGGSALLPLDFHLKSLQNITTFRAVRSPYVITLQHFPNYGTGSTDNFEISISNSPGDMNPNLPLNKQLIFGSHDSGTYVINSQSFITADAEFFAVFGKIFDTNLVNGWARTQSFTIAQQLANGVRYLDLRLCGGRYGGSVGDLGNSIVTCHALSGASLDNVIRDVQTFTNANPEAVILLDINHLYAITPNQLKYIMDRFTNTFGSKIASSQLTPSSPVSKFQSSNIQIVFLISATLTPELQAVLDNGNYNYWNANRIKSSFTETANINTRINILNNELANNASHPNELFVLQTQLTPNLTNIVNGLNKLHAYPRNLADFTGTYQFDISQWLIDNRDALSKAGLIVIRDFIGATPNAG